jgi:hypothetical protein
VATGVECERLAAIADGVCSGPYGVGVLAETALVVFGYGGSSMVGRFAYAQMVVANEAYTGGAPIGTRWSASR